MLSCKRKKKKIENAATHTYTNYVYNYTHVKRSKADENKKIGKKKKKKKMKWGDEINFSDRNQWPSGPPRLMVVFPYGDLLTLLWNTMS